MHFWSVPAELLDNKFVHDLQGDVTCQGCQAKLHEAGLTQLQPELNM